MYHNDLSNNFTKKRQEDIVKAIQCLNDINKDKNLPVELKEGNKFKDHFQVDRVVVIGHSLGGSSALTAAGKWGEHFPPQDPRIIGVVALDPWLSIMPIYYIESVNVPALIISADGWRNYKMDHRLLTHYISNRKTKIIEAIAKNTFHSNFSDFALYWNSYFSKMHQYLIKDDEDDKESPKMDIGIVDGKLMVMEVSKLILKYLNHLYTQKHTVFTEDNFLLEIKEHPEN